MNKKWEYIELDEEKLKNVEKIRNEYGISNLLAKILVNRNLTKKEDIDLFLRPNRHDFHNPYLMPDMAKAVDRIIKAINNNEKILIYGDYDVDGITSVTVVKSFLLERNAQVTHYIPNRLNEGYGLNKNAIEKIAKDGVNLIITVDCGISGIEEVEYANSLGLEVIVTDHHEVGEKLPNAIAVVDAKRKDNTYPFRELAGVGVGFKLIQAISQKLELEEKEYLKYLDIVCIGTISDIVPLVDENRVIAKLGLKLVEVTKNIGLKALIDVAGYKQIDSFTVSFGLAPRINACGRMGKEKEALNLFLTKDPKVASEIAIRLNEYNVERQEIEKKIYEDAVKKIEEGKEEKPAIVLGSEDWHHGVIGIVSSKITDLYFKPSILVCFEGEEGKGSGRSIPGFDIYESLTNCSENLEKFGGHSMAVGVTIKKQNFEKFKEEFEKYAQDSNICDIIPIIKIDEEVTLADVSIKAVEELKMLEPYGEANKTPLFMYKNLRIHSIRTLSEGKHIKLTLKDNNFYIDSIGFNLGHLAQEYQIGDKVDVVGFLEINKFNGRENLQINLKDLRKSY